MPAKRTASPKESASTANIGFEAKLWLAADKLRNNMDAAEYKHVVLGLIFLKYISDTFEEHRAKLLAGTGDYAGANTEDPDEYKAENVFWVPAEARWSHLQASAKLPAIGKTVDDAMVAIERDNPRLKGVLPKDYARPGLDKHRLGELIDLIGGIDLIERAPSPQTSPSGRGSEDGHYRGGYDFSGLLKLAREMRKKQTSAEDLIWELLRNRQLCNAKFRRQHQFGDYICDFYSHETKLVVECDGEPHHTAKGKQHGAKRDAYLKSQGLTVLHFENDRALIEADLVDCMVALPGQLFYSTQIPVCLWFIARDKSGGQPSPRPSPSRRGSKAAELPSTSGRGVGGEGRLRDRRGETLFIDARKLGTLIDRVHRELTDTDLDKITSTYHAWRGDGSLTRSREAREEQGTCGKTLRGFAASREYSDIPGFCKSATTAEIAAHGHVLTPGRYVGAEEVEDDGDPFEEKMPRLVAELHAQFAESAKLEAAIRKNLQGLGFH